MLTAILWGSGFISQKLGNRVMPPMTFNAVRQLMAAVVLTPIVLRVIFHVKAIRLRSWMIERSAP